MLPAALPAERHQPVERRLGDDDKIEAGRLEMCGGAVELVEQGRTRRAGALLAWQLRRLARRRLWPVVAGIAREHEIVDDEQILAFREELRQPDAGRLPGGIQPVEDIVLRHRSARRHGAAGLGDSLHGAA